MSHDLVSKDAVIGIYLLRPKNNRGQQWVGQTICLLPDTRLCLLKDNQTIQSQTLKDILHRTFEQAKYLHPE